MEEKARFLRSGFVEHLRTIDSTTPPVWGKMSLQQMIEHFSDAVRASSGKLPIKDILTPAEQLPKMQSFLMSDKPFRENTPNPLLPDMPPPVRHTKIEDALDELHKEIDYFFAVFEQNGQQTTRNPFFGDLNYEMNVQLLYKHARHHLRQFGVTIS